MITSVHSSLRLGGKTQKELTNVRLKAIEANICVREHDQVGCMLSIFICRRTVLGAESVPPAARRSDGRAEEYD